MCIYTLCCYHNVDYPAQEPERAGQAPNTLVIHFRSDLLRLRFGPQVFHRSNSLLSEVIAPIVARHLATTTYQLPSLADLKHVISKWRPPAS